MPRSTDNAYGVITTPRTIRFERRLPGPIGRVWAYLTESELRRQWLASGEMVMEAGTTFELVWRNDELTDPPGERPSDFASGEHRMQSRVIAAEPPRRLVITWGSEGEVSFELEQAGDEVLLTLIHSRLPAGSGMLDIAAGWHTHLDILAARAGGTSAEPFWEKWSRLKPDYERRLAA
jgi:uncharacterized protein YndB with AHSA1/START domain